MGLIAREPLSSHHPRPRSSTLERTREGSGVLLDVFPGVTCWLWARLGLGQWLVCVSPVMCSPLSHFPSFPVPFPAPGSQWSSDPELARGPQIPPTAMGPGWGHSPPDPEAPESRVGSANHMALTP